MSPTEPRFRILVVDDDDSTRNALSRWLSNDYDVICAANATDALALASASPGPDVILTDVWMPGLDGIAMVQRMKEMDHLRRVPIIFLTGQSAPRSVIAGIAAGARAYLHKPIDLDLLDRKLRSALRSRGRPNR